MRWNARDRGSLGEWTRTGTWALLDQAVNSGAGFALNLLLAMWLAPSEYGAFAVGFAIFLVLSGLHNAILIEPVSILGPSRHSERLGPYLRRQVVLHFLLTLPTSITVAAIGATLQASASTASVGRCLVGLGVALPPLLLFWTLRRFQYVISTPAVAVAGAVTYSAILLGLILAARMGGALTPAAGFLAMGIAGLLASAVLRVPATPSAEARGREALPALRSLLHEQWSYGRWMIAASLLSAAGLQLYSVICAATVGLAAAGTLRAMELLMLPMAQGITAIATLALPRLAADHGRGDLAGFSRLGHVISASLVAAALLYEMVLILWHRDLERLLFGGRFAQASWLIPVLGLIPILTAASAGFTLMLKAAQLPSHYLVGGIVVSAVGLPLNFLLGLRFGLAGFAWSLVFTYVASLVAVLEMYRRWVRPSVLKGEAALAVSQVAR